MQLNQKIQKRKIHVTHNNYIVRESTYYFHCTHTERMDEIADISTLFIESFLIFIYDIQCLFFIVTAIGSAL